MANKLYEESNIRAIADSIREKNGSTDTYKVSEMPSAIAELNGSEPLVEFSQMNQVVADYIANVTYSPNDYTTSQIGYYRLRETDYQKDHPSTYKVTLKEVGSLGLVNGNKANDSDSIVGENEIANLTPNEVHPWWNTADGNIKQCGTVKPTGQVRMIKLGNVRNVRDLGGWACDGGTVKYGKLYRGGALSSSETGSSITDVEIQMCRNLLGIQHEMDFRVSGEGVPTYSVLGEDVLYSKIPIGSITSNYALLVDLDGQYKDEMKSILTAIFESVKYNRPTYMHCTYGADRTGAISFIINGLLGVSQSDLDKDYELTSFYSTRARNENMYTGLINYLKACSTGNMRDCIVAWAVLLGISIDDINEFRRNMIDGNPANVSANVNYACTGISLSKTSGTVNTGDSVTITATVLPSWTTNNITWTSNNNGIATVSGSGKTATITGVAGGTTTITATCGNYSATYTVTVESTAEPPMYDGNILTTIGYTDGYRLSSSGGNSQKTGYVATNKIPITLRSDGTFDMLLSGIEWGKDSDCRFCTYKDGTLVTHGYMPRTDTGTSGDKAKGVFLTLNADGTVTVNLTASQSSTYSFNQIAFSGCGSGANAVIEQVI